MTPAPSAGAEITVSGDPGGVRALVAGFFTARGWSVLERDRERLEVETGSVWRSVLLGAFAGSRFRLSATITLRQVPGGIAVRCVWGAGAGAALGGSVGRSRATRAHRETVAALVEHLGADGRAVRSRPL